MATSYKTYANLHPGALGAHKLAQEHIPSEDGFGAYMGTYLMSILLGKNSFPLVSGFMPYTAAQWTVTGTGTGAAQAQATTPSGGVLLTTGSSSTFYSGLQSKATVTPAAGKVFSFIARVQVSHATQVGFNLGFGNAQADPTGTDYTDFIGFRKAPTSATVKGTVIGNSGSVTQTATLVVPVAATEFWLGFYVDLESTAGTCSGSWFYGTDPYNMTELAMSSTILTEVVKFLTTAPSDFSLTAFATGTSGNNATCTVTTLLGMVDN